jgi:hypothetical protein
MHGGMKVYAGPPAAARAYLEADRDRADDYHLAEGTVVARGFAGCGERVEERAPLAGDLRILGGRPGPRHHQSRGRPHNLARTHRRLAGRACHPRLPQPRPTCRPDPDPGRRPQARRRGRPDPGPAGTGRSAWNAADIRGEVEQLLTAAAIVTDAAVRGEPGRGPYRPRYRPLRATTARRRHTRRGCRGAGAHPCVDLPGRAAAARASEMLTNRATRWRPHLPDLPADPARSPRSPTGSTTARRCRRPSGLPPAAPPKAAIPSTPQRVRPPRSPSTPPAGAARPARGPQPNDDRLRRFGALARTPPRQRSGPASTATSPPPAPSCRRTNPHRRARADPTVLTQPPSRLAAHRDAWRSGRDTGPQQRATTPQRPADVPWPSPGYLRPSVNRSGDGPAFAQ